MSNKLARRSFLGRISVALSSALAFPGLLISSNKSEKEKPEEKPTIKEVKPMGFQWETSDPFLFCVHHEDKFPKGNDEMGPAASLKGRSLGDDFIIKDGFRMYHGKKVPGFPGHPHRGFETITVVREGVVDHSDSLGAAGRYGHGDVQWMTAGSGVLHSEMFPLIHKDKDNPLELFQIWLNLPARDKMVDAHFKMLWAEDIPNYRNVDLQDREILIEIMAGELNGMKAPSPPPSSWAAKPENGVTIYNIKMDAGRSWTLPAAQPGLNRTLYFYRGQNMQIAGRNIPNYNLVKVESDRDIVLKNGNQRAGILMLQGRPINEPVVQYGPFVMNTREEINQTFRDYNRTRFGGWPWPEYDYVHPRNEGRFAKHADGRIERPS